LTLTDLIHILKVRKVIIKYMADHHFAKILGTGTLNDKGQLVIPAEARASLSLKSGDKLVIMRSPDRPALVLIKAEEVESMIKSLSQALTEENED
jgi:AbrB family looped-hinge helix DNA binding protein